MSRSLRVIAVVLGVVLVTGCDERPADEPSPDSTAHSTANSPALRVAVADGNPRFESLDQLLEALPAQEIDLFDAVYQKPKRYRGFELRAVCELLFGDDWSSGAYSEVVFQALDGYEAIASLTMVEEPGGYLVFHDLDVPDWEPIGRRQSNPGPFYVVWTGAEQTTQHAYPWPYQVEELHLVRFEDNYPKTYPHGKEPGTAAFSGFDLFRHRCIRCHSMNREGGKIGPDLNAPQSVTSYRSEEMIRAFISHPSEYRYTNMPDHPDLSDTDLDHLLAYFRYMASLGATEESSDDGAGQRAAPSR